MCESKYKIGDFVKFKNGTTAYIAFKDTDGTFMLLQTILFRDRLIPIAKIVGNDGAKWWWTTDIENEEMPVKPEIFEGDLQEYGVPKGIYRMGKFVRWGDVKHFYGE